MFENNVISWAILVSVLIFLGYTLIVIREEDTSYQESATPLFFHQFKLMVPSWWGLINESEQLLEWQRTDTRYDWKAKIEFQNSISHELSIEEEFRKKIEDLHVVFDLDTSNVLGVNYFKDHKLGKIDGLEVIRIEGTATKDITDRRYLDAFLIRDIEKETTLFATSTSSILNGLIEGPYFENMIYNLNKKDS